MYIYVCMYVQVCMYVCMYVCTYVCIYVCMYVCMYVCTYVYMYVCIYVCTYIHTCKCMYTCIYMYTCMYASFCLSSRDVSLSNLSLLELLQLSKHKIYESFFPEDSDEPLDSFLRDLIHQRSKVKSQTIMLYTCTTNTTHPLICKQHVGTWGT